MAWTYLQFDADWEFVEGSPQRPGPQTAYLGFDVLRGVVLIAYTERGGSSSFFGPNVEDDCNIVAFAPLSETTDPDIEEIKRLTPWRGDAMYKSGAPFRLMR